MFPLLRLMMRADPDMGKHNSVQGRILSSRLWAATKPDASFMAKHFKASLQNLLTDHGLSLTKSSDCCSPAEA